MRVKIEIDGVALDLLDGTDESFYLTSSVYDVSDLNTRKSTYSREINVPSTPNNRKLLNIESNERAGNKSTPILLVIDGITFALGRLFITAIQKDEVSIIILFTNFDLFDRLTEEPIGNISFNEYNFPFTIAGFQGIATNTEGPVLLLHYWIEEENLLYEGLVPGIANDLDIKTGGFDMYQKTIFRKIIESAGYTLDDSLINTNDTYNSLVLATPLPAFQQEEVPTGDTGEVSLTAPFVHTPTGAGQQAVVQWDDVITDTGSLWDGALYAWVLTATGEYNIVCDYSVGYIQNGPGVGTIELQRNGNVIDSDTFLLQGSNINGTLSSLNTFNIDDVFRIVVTCSYHNQQARDTITVNTSSQFNLTQTNDPLTGDVVVSEWLPKISQRKFFIDFCKHFNLFFSANSFTKTVKPIFWKDYINETPFDLSDKIDISLPISDKISLPYYRESQMTFVDAGLSRDDTNYSVDLSSDNSLPPFGTVLSIGSSNSDLSQYQRQTFATSALYTPYYKWTFSKIKNFSITLGTANFTISTTDQTPQFQSGDYIMWGPQRTFVSRVSQRTGLGTGIFFNNTTVTYSNVDAYLIKVESQSLNYRHGIAVANDNTSASVNVNANEYGGGAAVNVLTKEFRALNMEAIFDEFYVDFFSAVENPKLITCWMSLSTVDFYDLDLLKPVYIRMFNGNYHINKIEQFKLNTPCRVELIRINQGLEGSIRKK